MGTSTRQGAFDSNASPRMEFSSDGCSTRKPRSPNAFARSAKSGLLNSVPTVRLNFAICFHRMLPNPLSRKTRFTVGAFSRLAVSSSWTLMRNPPSPLTVTTRRFGSISFAAIPPGTAMPIGEPIDVNDPSVPPRVPGARIVFDEVVSDADHEVGIVESGELVVVRENADGQQAHRGGPRNRAFPHHRGHHGNVEAFRELRQL